MGWLQEMAQETMTCLPDKASSPTHRWPFLVFLFLSLARSVFAVSYSVIVSLCMLVACLSPTPLMSFVARFCFIVSINSEKCRGSCFFEILGCRKIVDKSSCFSPKIWAKKPIVLGTFRAKLEILSADVGNLPHSARFPLETSIRWQIASCPPMTLLSTGLFCCA